MIALTRLLACTSLRHCSRFSVDITILGVTESNFFTRLITACLLLTQRFAWLHATAPLLCTALDDFPEFCRHFVARLITKYRYRLPSDYKPLAITVLGVVLPEVDVTIAGRRSPLYHC